MTANEPHLSFRTYADSEPHGKTRVFFTCHPDDYAAYFDEIVRLIFEYQKNCAIWYEDTVTDGTGGSNGRHMSDQQLMAQLFQMQLVIIPVTGRLLTRPSRAMNLVVPFALENHIPILPLMMEGGLEELFSSHFGDLQFLMPGQNDPTAIPFEQKLERYLNNVLVGEETAQKVRDAFDAYIFLSYRKKDREQAHQLMKLIHRIERFRDFAIWYDEYLIPGENFNDAIKKALKDSILLRWS